MCLKLPFILDGILKAKKEDVSELMSRKGFNLSDLPFYRCDHNTLSVRKGAIEVKCSDAEFAKMVCIKPPILFDMP